MLNDRPTFRPWIGSAYATGGVLGLRFLILGESHYGSGADEVVDPEVTNALCLQARVHPAFAVVLRDAN